jgi:hypothetical protein
MSVADLSRPCHYPSRLSIEARSPGSLAFAFLPSAVAYFRMKHGYDPPLVNASARESSSSRIPKNQVSGENPPICLSFSPEGNVVQRDLQGSMQRGTQVTPTRDHYDRHAYEDGGDEQLSRRGGVPPDIPRHKGCKWQRRKRAPLNLIDPIEDGVEPLGVGGEKHKVDHTPFPRTTTSG